MVHIPLSALGGVWLYENGNIGFALVVMPRFERIKTLSLWDLKLLGFSVQIPNGVALIVGRTF